MDNQILERLVRIETLLITRDKDALTLDEVALFTGLSKSYIYKLTSSNKIPFYKRNGKNLYFSKKEIEEWLLQNRVKTKDEIDVEAANYLQNQSKK